MKTQAFMKMNHSHVDHLNGTVTLLPGMSSYAPVSSMLAHSNVKLEEVTPVEDLESTAMDASLAKPYFAFNCATLMEMMEERNPTKYKNQFGGIEGLSRGLHSDVHMGLPVTDQENDMSTSHAQHVPAVWQHILSPDEWTEVNENQWIKARRDKKKRKESKQKKAKVSDAAALPSSSVTDPSSPSTSHATPPSLDIFVPEKHAPTRAMYSRRLSHSDLLVSAFTPKKQRQSQDRTRELQDLDNTDDDRDPHPLSRPDTDKPDLETDDEDDADVDEDDHGDAEGLTTPRKAADGDHTLVLAVPTQSTDLLAPILVEEQEDDPTGVDARFPRTAPSKPLPPTATATTVPPSSHFLIRRRLFGANILPPVRNKSLWLLMWEAWQDKVLILLSIAALISLAIGIYEDVREPDPTQRFHWIEGFAIMMAVIIVVTVTALNDYQKERQFRMLNAKKDDRLIQVTRGGDTVLVHIAELVIGDLLILSTGDVLPADAVVVSARDLTCDESGMTGESKQIRKDPVRDPFLLSGTRVLEGQGMGLVVAVGEHSLYGKTLMSLRVPSQLTPLQRKLGGLAETLAKLGLVLGLVLLVVLVLKYVISSSIHNSFGPGDEIGSKIISIFIQSITIIIVAVPEGLPMAVTLALAYSTVQMLKDQNLVRVLAACETMGGATTICSDKTGTLTLNKMTVVQGWMAGILFQQDTEENPTQQQQNNNAVAVEKTALAKEGSVVKTLYIGNASINSTVREGKDERGVQTLMGNKTETALVEFVRTLSSTTVDPMAVRSEAQILGMIPFSSERKRMTTSVRLPGGIVRIYAKGAAEMILRLCTSYGEEQPDGQMRILPMNTEERAYLDAFILQLSNQSLRTICLAYRDVSEEEYWSTKVPVLDEQGNPVEDLGESEHLALYERDLVCCAIVGIEDPVRAEVPDAVSACQRAHIVVRMVTGDNLITARHIARRCHLLQKGDIIMEGPEFRRLPPELLLRVLPRLRVLARSSPMDKQLLVQKLKQLGETVAVTGDGTNDAPALKMADVGFSMGITGTEVAKEASDIVVLDDNFTSIVSAVVWGRNVYESIRKFVQFQLTVNAAAIIIAFVSAIVSDSDDSALAPIQLLWINIIMDSGAALALATERPDREHLLSQKPARKSDNLISGTMWKMVLGVAAFQILICFLILYVGPLIFSGMAAYPTAASPETIRTFVFNAFVWMQLFNEFNARRIDNRIDIFHQIHKNYYFIGIFLFTVVIQVILVQWGGRAFRTVPLPWFMWLLSVGLGTLVIPVGVALRLWVPDAKMPQWLSTWLMKRRRQRVERRKRRRQKEKEKKRAQQKKKKQSLENGSATSSSGQPTRQPSELSLTVSSHLGEYQPTDDEILNQESYRWHSAIRNVMAQIRVVKALRKPTSA